MEALPVEIWGPLAREFVSILNAPPLLDQVVGFHLNTREGCMTTALQLMERVVFLVHLGAVLPQMSFTIAYREMNNLV